MTQQNRNSLNNLAKQEVPMLVLKEYGHLRLELNCLSDIVTERKAAFIPMGDLYQKFARSMKPMNGFQLPRIGRP